jgi:muramoyltetrapeptide carboxypeptidase
MPTIDFNRQKDVVAIIAPSSGCADAHLKLTKGIKLLEDNGLKSTVDERIFAYNDIEFFAASKEVRLDTFKQALLNEAVKIIWAFRGGYGCNEFIFDCLDIKPLGTKILIGYSDLTSLHILFNQHYNIPTIHGSVLTSMLANGQRQDIKHIINVLNGDEVRLDLEPILPNFDNIDIDGKTIGGNMTVFCTMLGTKLYPKTEKKILVLEDINEKGYYIHRCLIHLKNAGIFDDLNAVIFGDFLNGDHLVKSAIEHFCYNHIQNIPSYRTIGIGHGNINYPVILGNLASINRNKLVIQSQFRLL